MITVYYMRVSSDNSTVANMLQTKIGIATILCKTMRSKQINPR